MTMFQSFLMGLLMVLGLLRDSRKGQQKPWRPRLGFEALEDRQVPAGLKPMVIFQNEFLDPQTLKPGQQGVILASMHVQMRGSSGIRMESLNFMHTEKLGDLTKVSLVADIWNSAGRRKPDGVFETTLGTIENLGQGSITLPMGLPVPRKHGLHLRVVGDVSDEPKAGNEVTLGAIEATFSQYGRRRGSFKKVPVRHIGVELPVHTVAKLMVKPPETFVENFNDGVASILLAIGSSAQIVPSLGPITSPEGGSPFLVIDTKNASASTSQFGGTTGSVAYSEPFELPENGQVAMLVNFLTNEFPGTVLFSDFAQVGLVTEDGEKFGVPFLWLEPSDTNPIPVGMAGTGYANQSGWLKISVVGFPGAIEID